MAKKDVCKVGKLTDGKENLINGLLQEYDIQDASDIQDALKICLVEQFKKCFNLRWIII